MKTAYSRISDMSNQQRNALADEFDKASRVAMAEPVAVVGIGCRFPGDVPGPESFWQLLVEGSMRSVRCRRIAGTRTRFTTPIR